MYRVSFKKLVKGERNVNLKDFEGATYKVIVVCLFDKQIPKGGQNYSKGEQMNPTPKYLTKRQGFIWGGGGGEGEGEDTFS